MRLSRGGACAVPGDRNSEPACGRTSLGLGDVLRQSGMLTLAHERAEKPFSHLIVLTANSRGGVLRSEVLSVDDCQLIAGVSFVRSPTDCQACSIAGAHAVMQLPFNRLPRTIARYVRIGWLARKRLNASFDHSVPEGSAWKCRACLRLSR